MKEACVNATKAMKASPAKRWHGRLSAWNRNLLNQFTNLTAPELKKAETEDGETDGGDNEEDEYSQAESTSPGAKKSPTKESTKSATRHRPADFTPEKETPRFKKEHTIKHRQLCQQRESDLKHVRDKCDRSLQHREEKFERDMNDIKEQDQQRKDAGMMLLAEEQRADEKKEQRYQDWDSCVYKRIQNKLYRCLNPQERHAPPTQLFGGSTRMHLMPGDDPLKTALHEREQESIVSRKSNSLIFSARKGGGASASRTHGGELSLDELENLWDERLTTRPVLHPVTWGQLEFPSTVYGFFAYSGRREDGTFHTQKRRGNDRHIPNERDGISTAGKTRNRSLGQRIGEKNDLGVLTGNWPRRGQGYRFKQEIGGSCAAPLQDHYFFSREPTAADNEFPPGKRIMPNMH